MLHLAITELNVLLDNFRDPKIPQGLCSSFDGHLRSLLPGFSAGADQLDHVVHVLWHDCSSFDTEKRKACTGDKSISTRFIDKYSPLGRRDPVAIDPARTPAAGANSRADLG